LRDTHHTFAYDAANRLTTMTQGALRTTYTYGATGNQTGEQTVGVGFTTFAYDNANRLTGIAFLAASGCDCSTRPCSLHPRSVLGR
jgi:YD repeat-containing protein